MAKYSDIKGFTVQTVSTDPAASVADSGSWASASGLNTGRSQVDGCGIITAALVTGGYTTTNVANTESWNGSAWSEVNDLNAATRDKAVIGTYTAAVAAGGNPPSTNNESWNGSSWTEVNNINTARGGGKGVGTNTAGLMYGGYGTARSALNESWDGTNWTEVGDMNTARSALSGSGTQTAALAFNGGPNANIGANAKDTESWNGSSWTTLSSSSNTNIEAEGAGSCGTQTDALLFGGSIYDSSGPNARTEAWNGSAWTEVGGNLGTGRSVGADSGTGSTSAMLAGGSSETTATEQWTTAFTPTTLVKITEGQLFYNSTTNAFKETIFDIPAATWSSGGNLNTTRKQAMGFGILTANIMAGGDNPSPAVVDNVEQYNGSSWTEITEINTARRNGKGSGTTTAGIVFGGEPNSKNSETWNGSAWTEVGDLTRSTAVQSFGTAGASSTSAIIYGGEPGTGEFTYTETWDGSSWTEVNNLNTGRQGPAGFGIVTAALCAGGYSPPAPPGNVLTNVEKFDGTSWTEINDINTARGSFAGSGSATSGLIFGGQAPPGKLAQTEAFDGTSFTEVADLSKGIYEQGYAPLGASPQSNQAAISAGGKDANPGTLNITEEWEVPLANKTITSS